MVKATSLDMSLSDIISKNKKSKKVVKRPIKKAGGGGAKIQKRGRINQNQNNSNNGTPKRGIVRKAIRKSGGGPNENRTVRINISNLAPTVLSSDLHELFGEFNLRRVSVNFNEGGSPAGTGDLTLSKRDSDRLIQKFAGVALDGKVMQFAVIESSSAVIGSGGPPSRGGTPKTRKIPAKSPRRSQEGASVKKTQKKPKKTLKPAKKTAEELDAELDAYMSRN